MAGHSSHLSHSESFKVKYFAVSGKATKD